MALREEEKKKKRARGVALKNSFLFARPRRIKHGQRVSRLASGENLKQWKERRIDGNGRQENVELGARRDRVSSPQPNLSSATPEHLWGLQQGARYGGTACQSNLVGPSIVRLTLRIASPRDGMRREKIQTQLTNEEVRFGLRSVIASHFEICECKQAQAGWQGDTRRRTRDERASSPATAATETAATSPRGMTGQGI